MNNITHYIHDLKVEILDINATDCPYRVTNLTTGESWMCPIESGSWHTCGTLLEATKSNQGYLLHSLSRPDHEAVKVEQHKPVKYTDVEVEGDTVCYELHENELFYWDSDGQYHWDPEPYVDPDKLAKFKVQVASANGWADLKASVAGGPYEVELYGSHAAALADVGDELNPREFRIVPEGTAADDDLY
jgi:hypothetical protein